MKANELREGNYTYYPTVELETGQSVLEVIKMDIKDILSHKMHGKYLPIPITTEWLERFGFEQYLIGYYRYKEFYISYSNTGLHEYRQRDAYVIFKYIHQLQNLYFALTGEELEIKPNI